MLSLNAVFIVLARCKFPFYVVWLEYMRNRRFALAPVMNLIFVYLTNNVIENN